MTSGPHWATLAAMLLVGAPLTRVVSSSSRCPLPRPFVHRHIEVEPAIELSSNPWCPIAPYSVRGHVLVDHSSTADAHVGHHPASSFIHSTRCRRSPCSVVHHVVELEKPKNLRMSKFARLDLCCAVSIAC